MLRTSSISEHTQILKGLIQKVDAMKVGSRQLNADAETAVLYMPVVNPPEADRMPSVFA